MVETLHLQCTTEDTPLCSNIVLLPNHNNIAIHVVRQEEMCLMLLLAFLEDVFLVFMLCRVVSQVVSCLSSAVSVVVLWQTRHDVLLSR